MKSDIILPFNHYNDLPYRGERRRNFVRQILSGEEILSASRDSRIVSRSLFSGARAARRVTASRHSKICRPSYQHNELTSRLLSPRPPCINSFCLFISLSLSVSGI